jgi:AraC-like DNA-binding protein
MRGICISENIQKNAGWVSWSDSIENGNSRTLDLSASEKSAMWIFRLDKGAAWPFVGLSYNLNKSDYLVIDKKKLQENDSLVMDLKMNKPGYVIVQLSVVDPNITKPSDSLSYRVLQTTITVQSEKKRIAIPLHNFRVAEWWRLRYRVAPEDTNRYLTAIQAVEWAVSDTSLVGKIDTLHIGKFEFIRKKTHISVVWFIGFIVLLFLGVAMVFSFRPRKQHFVEKPILNDVSVNQIAPIPLETAPSDWERVMAYIQANYHKQEIDIETVAKELGFSESKLSRLIRDHHAEGFRALIHSLRICEACRLLKETELNITEIAYMLGYATPSHFNREFKAREGVTPTSYRKIVIVRIQNG